MKAKLLILSIFFFCSTFVVFGQSEEKPIPILPGGEISNTTPDTMWVLHSTKQFKKTIVALNQYKACMKLNETRQQAIDSLEILYKVQKEVSDSTKREYDICYAETHEMDQKITLLGEMNDKQSKYTRIAIIVGASTTVAAFVVGFVLGIK